MILYTGNLVRLVGQELAINKKYTKFTLILITKLIVYKGSE